MNRYPRWKVGLLIAVLLFCGLYALPNLYPDAPAVQISGAEAGAKVPDALTQTVLEDLKQAHIPYTGASREGNSWLIEFASTDVQLQAKMVIDKAIGSSYVAALNLVPTTPHWLRLIGAKPMNLGLDLRGGVHFLLQVDMKAAINQRLDGNMGEIKQTLRDADVRYRDVVKGKEQLTVLFASAEDMSKGEGLIRQKFSDFLIMESRDQKNTLLLSLTPVAIQNIQNYAIDQNRTALSNRVDDLGVSNAVVRRQGADRIVVELPGVQDAAQARRILGKTATLEFRLADESVDPSRIATGIAPPGTQIFPFKNTPRKVVLKTEKIVTGDQVTNAQMGFDQQTGVPEVDITLDAAGARRMQRVTAKHVGDPMAVLFIETKTEKKVSAGKDGKEVVDYVSHNDARVINVATIRDTLGSRFRITGLDSAAEASELALLLRAGSLAAPVFIVGESTIGPSLGAANIKAGMISMLVGLILVLLFMSLYYKLAGLVACIALLGNLIVLVGVMSLIPGATLTLPGIAGIVLTLGMAVDANVLIYEQIKHSIRDGMKPVRALEHGYDRAFITIVDANLTTIIAGIVLLAMGSGAVQGFAVTLIIGILASMFTAIIGSRAILEVVYARPGRKPPTRLSI
jgi:preprotein translocase subunit SecD